MRQAPYTLFPCSLVRIKEKNVGVACSESKHNFAPLGKQN